MRERLENHLALLELVATGSLKRRKSQEQAWRHLAELPWTQRTGRRDELAVTEAYRGELLRLLHQVWPGWQQVHTELSGANLPINEQGWRVLQDMERAREAKGLPSRLNRRTATAAVGPHSKAHLSEVRQQTLADMEVMHDGLVRLRPSSGLRIRRSQQELDASVVAGVLGELVLTERALSDGTVLAGTRPHALLLVENLGAYLDAPAPAGWLLAHVPGWDTPTVRLLLTQLADVPVAHFGDLDPNGVRIMRHLRSFRPDLQWVVPAFWRDYIPKASLEAQWPADLDLAEVPDLVRELATAGRWLEQECIVLDPRFADALQHIFGTGIFSATSTRTT
jgi:hypothetical protein